MQWPLVCNLPCKYYSECSAHPPCRPRPPPAFTCGAAHVVELQVAPASGPLEVYQYIVAADDGRVLRRHDLSAYEAFQYRVPADADGDHRPFDGPLADFTPHPTGVPGQGPKGVNPPALVAMEGFNTNPNAVADPWLAPGATETVGNNVDAYVDHKTPNGLDIDLGDFRATVTAPGVSSPTEGSDDSAATMDLTGTTGTTDPGTATDSGCACTLDERDSNNWQHLLPWLGLLGLRRRRDHP